MFLSKTGYVFKNTQIQMLPKQPGKYHFDLTKIIKTKNIKITINVHDTTIYIDKKNVGITPYLDEPKLEINTHQIVMKKEQYTNINQTFTMKENSLKNLKFQLFLINPTPS